MPQPTDHAPRRARASRLPPDERRAAIIEATIPLVRRHGYAVTTRQIAEAADVAEGTLFRVFEDKDSLVQEAICAALEPAGVELQIGGIDRDLPLRARLIQAAEILQQRLQDVFQLFAAVGMNRPPGGHESHESRPTRPIPHEDVTHAIEALIEPDRDALRLPPAEAARLLRVLTFAGSHTGVTDGQTMTPDEIVAVLLDGVLDHSTHS